MGIKFGDRCIHNKIKRSGCFNIGLAESRMGLKIKCILGGIQDAGKGGIG